MQYTSNEATSRVAPGFKFLTLFLAFALLTVFSLSQAQARNQSLPGVLAGYVPPPPDAAEDYPVPREPTRVRPPVDRDELEPLRLPFTVFPPPISEYAVDLKELGLKLKSAREVDRIVPADGTHALSLEPGTGKKLVIATLQGSIDRPVRMPVAIHDFTAFWVEEKEKDIFGKRVTEQIVPLVRAAALETWTGWLVEGVGLQEQALFYFLDPGPVTLQVGFIFPKEVTSFGVRYPMAAEGEATLEIKEFFLED